MDPSRPFPVRVGAHMLAIQARAGEPAPDVPTHIVDQINAAADHASSTVPDVATVVEGLEPDSNWRLSDETMNPLQAYELQARIAAALDWARLCIHLRQPDKYGYGRAVFRLALGRVDCDRCVQTQVARVVGDDACDWCRDRTEVFYPTAFAFGTMVIAGDICHGCRVALPADIEPPTSAELPELD